jgi:hypothetical protein
MQANAASDNTVDDYTRRPTLINNLQYIAGYGGADMANGAFSFQGGAFNWFGSLTSRAGAVAGQPNPDDVRFGLANRTFGAGLMLAMSKSSTDVDGVGSTRTTLEADGYALFGDFNLGGSDVYGEIAMRTGFGAFDGLDHNIKIDPDVGATQEDKNLMFQFLVGWKRDATTEGTHAVNAELALSVDSKKDQIGAPDTAQALSVSLGFAHGYIAKQTTGFSAFLGSNAILLYESLNPNDPLADESAVTLAVIPNASFQKTLAKGFEAFVGASVALAVVYDKVEPPPGGDTDSWLVISDGADVAAGLRWVYENFAIEGHLNETLLFNGPYLVGGTASPMFGGTGGAIGLSVGF